ncbi:hypothetical protein MP638_001997 [Amoeboaphelidium occidentale]|nr:hypothetical protein MP638_001997 [Amoeboaphelidium occidentale]
MRLSLKIFATLLTISLNTISPVYGALSTMSRCNSWSRRCTVPKNSIIREASRVDFVRKQIDHRRRLNEHLVPVPESLLAVNDGIQRETQVHIDSNSFDLEWQEFFQRKPSRVDILKYLALQYLPTNKKQLEESVRKRFGSIGVKAYGELSKLHPIFLQLLIDPGLVIHIDEFLLYLRKNYDMDLLRDSVDVWELRQEFSKSLGTRKAYRAMILKHQDIPRVLEVGIHSHALQEILKPRSNKDELLSNEDNIHETTELKLADVINRHIAYCSDPARDYIVSTSEFLEIAIVATLFQLFSAKFHYYADTEIVLFDLEIPLLDSFSAWPGDVTAKETLAETEVTKFGLNMERFASWTIQPDEIKRARVFQKGNCKITDYEDYWHRMITQMQLNVRRKSSRVCNPKGSTNVSIKDRWAAFQYSNVVARYVMMFLACK